MGSPFGIGGDSKTEKTVTTTTVNDQGQYVGRRGTVAQGGAFQAVDSVLAPQISVGRNAEATINYTQGLDSEGLRGLLGEVTTATQGQIDAATQAQSGQLDTFKNLLTNQSETAAGNPKLVILVIIGVLALVAFIFRKRL